MGTAKSVKKDDILQAIENLSHEELLMLKDYLDEMKSEAKSKCIEQDDVLDMEAFNSLMDNYSETLKGLVER